MDCTTVLDKRERERERSHNSLFSYISSFTRLIAHDYQCEALKHDNLNWIYNSNLPVVYTVLLLKPMSLQ